MQSSALTQIELEAVVDGVRRQHGRAGLLILADLCRRELNEDAPWPPQPSLVGP